MARRENWVDDERVRVLRNARKRSGTRLPTAAKQRASGVRLRCDRRRVTRLDGDAETVRSR